MNHRLYRKLYEAYGPQHWWPGESAFEVMVGAILTQNTSWTNVEKAIAHLKRHSALDPQSIVDAPLDQLAGWLRSSGYFNMKARRLKAFCAWYLDNGGMENLASQPTEQLRSMLLGIHGIGPETADSILLYAFERPVFVIDQYTRRLLQRLGYPNWEEPYDKLRCTIEKSLTGNSGLFNEFHALIVAHAKEHCRKKPLCVNCVLTAECWFSN